MANCCMTVWRFGDLVDTVVQMSVRRSVFVSLFSHATIGQIKKTSTGFFSPIHQCRRKLSEANSTPFWNPPTLLPPHFVGIVCDPSWLV